MNSVDKRIRFLKKENQKMEFKIKFNNKLIETLKNMGVKKNEKNN